MAKAVTILSATKDDAYITVDYSNNDKIEIHKSDKGVAITIYRTKDRTQGLNRGMDWVEPRVAPPNIPQEDRDVDRER